MLVLAAAEPAEEAGPGFARVVESMRRRRAPAGGARVGPGHRRTPPSTPAEEPGRRPAREDGDQRDGHRQARLADVVLDASEEAHEHDEQRQEAEDGLRGDLEHGREGEVDEAHAREQRVVGRRPAPEACVESAAELPRMVAFSDETRAREETSSKKQDPSTKPSGNAEKAPKIAQETSANINICGFSFDITNTDLGLFDTFQDV